MLPSVRPSAIVSRTNGLSASSCCGASSNAGAAVISAAVGYCTTPLVDEALTGVSTRCLTQK